MTRLTNPSTASPAGTCLRRSCGRSASSCPPLAAPHIRTATEILIDTGRPEDVLALPLDCLTADADGSPVLVYDNHKANRLGRRLPIPAATAQQIRAQQQRVRGKFPSTPVSDLKLLPAGWANRDGRRPLTVSALSAAHREWITSLPPLLLPDGTEYDKDRVIPYAYRHTYAQRHADAGVPIDVLAELLDHRSLNVTAATSGSARNAAATPSTRSPPCSSTGTATGSGVRSARCWTTSTPGTPSAPSPSPTAPAPSRPTSPPAAPPARSGSAAPAATTSGPTSPTCPT